MTRNLQGSAWAAIICMPCVPALAQTPQMVHTIHWTEVDAVTHAPVASANGILEPGEAARITVDGEMVPGIGGAASFQWPFNGVGELSGFRGTYFALTPTGEAAGTWSHPTSAPGLAVQWTPANLMPPNGQYPLAGASQLPGPSPWAPDPINPIPGLWEAVWTPASYAPRMTGFVIQGWSHVPAPASVYVRFESQPGVWVHGEGIAAQVVDSTQIPVVPGPSACALLGIVGAAACARRRRRQRMSRGCTRR